MRLNRLLVVRVQVIVRFLRSQNGWNTVGTLLYALAVAGGYAWAQSGDDAFDRFCRMWLVMWESLAGCGLMLAWYLSPPWFRKPNAVNDASAVSR